MIACMCVYSISTTFVCVIVSVITHQVHSGGGVTEGHADPGGCVSDDLMIHLLESDFIFFFVHQKALLIAVLTGLTPLGAVLAAASALV